jgi:hypothetical protein
MSTRAPRRSATPSVRTGGKWDLYEGYSKVGYIKPSYGGKSQVYQP